MTGSTFELSGLIQTRHGESKLRPFLRRVSFQKGGDITAVEAILLSPPPQFVNQKLILIEPCITRGVRAVVGVPKLVRVCRTCAVQMFPAVAQVLVGSGLTLT